MPCTTVRPLSLAVDYCYQLLTALVYMRSCRVIHNDIKPDNVLIKEDGGILLIDFGESVVFPQSFVFGGNATIRLDANSASTRTKVDAFNALRSITQSDLYDYNSESSLYVPSGINAAGKVLDRGVVGTPAFVAPELINLECSPKCDVWSFGVLVYCMVFGRLPFAAANTRDTYEAVLSAPLTFPAFEAYQDDLTETEYEQWKSFCTEILVREPAVRPSADALLRHKLLETRTLFPLALPAVKSVVTNPLVPDSTSRSHTSSDGSELLRLVSITSDMLPVSVVPRAPARQMIVSTKEEAAVLQVAEEASRSRMTRLSEAVKTNS
ncbi:Protein kinase domain containing protein, putative [Angomonas deanei]|uniref:Protein kinase domain containing protein, putative n=1 Tax=Angomonas deanei TaxID=59799 RepID=A0A7G2C670_9TRYP|nr:Protein kinase domain containing protein, putative [Angomonas deanei]